MEWRYGESECRTAYDIIVKHAAVTDRAAREMWPAGVG